MARSEEKTSWLTGKTRTVHYDDDDKVVGYSKEHEPTFVERVFGTASSSQTDHFDNDDNLLGTTEKHTTGAMESFFSGSSDSYDRHYDRDHNLVGDTRHHDPGLFETIARGSSKGYDKHRDKDGNEIGRSERHEPGLFEAIGRGSFDPYYAHSDKDGKRIGESDRRYHGVQQVRSGQFAGTSGATTPVGSGSAGYSSPEDSSSSGDPFLVLIALLGIPLIVLFSQGAPQDAAPPPRAQAMPTVVTQPRTETRGSEQLFAPLLHPGPIIDQALRQGSSQQNGQGAESGGQTARQYTGTARPSFDCAKSTLPSEYEICASNKLANLDVTMARRYSALKGRTSGESRTRLVKGQRRWLNIRNHCGANQACLENAYTSRISQFPPITMPSFDCSKSALPSEYVICNSDYLSGLDATMARRYLALRKRLSGNALRAFTESQRSWLNLRNRCGTDLSCLTRAYQERVHALPPG